VVLLRIRIYSVLRTYYIHKKHCARIQDELCCALMAVIRVTNIYRTKLQSAFRAATAHAPYQTDGLHTYHLYTITSQRKSQACEKKADATFVLQAYQCYNALNFCKPRRGISELQFERKHICNIHAYEYNFINTVMIKGFVGVCVTCFVW
jgi:hypothetical protein